LRMYAPTWLSKSKEGVDIVFGRQNPESRHRSCGGVLWFLAGCVGVFACAKIENVVKREKNRM
jgi:hypothetical protein